MMDTTSYFENRMKEALAGIRAGIGRNERPEPEVSPAKRQASFCRELPNPGRLHHSAQREADGDSAGKINRENGLRSTSNRR
jgi:hypothetical protein